MHAIFGADLNQRPTTLSLRSQGGEVRKDITDEECQGGCVQAVAWSPTRDEFVLISGVRNAVATAGVGCLGCPGGFVS